MTGRCTRAERAVAGVVSTALAVGGLIGIQMTTAPAEIIPDQPVSANASPMWQTNNSVQTLTVADGVVYAGGDFTRVRPPNTVAGAPTEVVRNRIAAFNANSGNLVTGFNQSANGRVLDLAVSPDGTKLYVVGAFTSIGGVARGHVARLNLPSGELDTAWTADANATVATVTVSDAAVYVGGDFTNIKAVNRTRIARLSPSTGAVSAAFTATSDARISESVLAPDGSRLLVGGENNVVNGSNRPAIASLDPTTGALRTWEATGIVPRVAVGGGCNSRVTDIVVDGAVAYVTAEGSQAGCWEGVYSADIADGEVNFNYTCLGGSMGLAVAHGWLYRGSHNHDCAKNVGGYSGQTSAINTWYRLQVHDVNDGRLGHWSPNTNGGSPGTETTVGPLAITTDGTQIFIGGDQSQVNGWPQQGLTRFNPSGGNTPPAAPAAPVAVASGPGKVTITVEGIADDNDGMLSYRLYRNGGANPIKRLTVESWPWSRPVLRFVDTGRRANTFITYEVLVNDGSGNGPRSPASLPVKVKGTKEKVYQSAIKVAPLQVYWRLNGSGASQSDSSRNGRTGTVVGSVLRAQPGAITGNNAIVTDGSSGYVRSTTAFTPSVNFTQSVWFKTTTKVGGAIMGFANQPTGPGSLDNRAIWMDNDGKIGFGVRRGSVSNPSRSFVRSNLTYNDGRWHQAVATYNGSRITLFMDGVQVSTLGVTSVVPTGPGYLRAGYLDLARFYAVYGGNYDGAKVPRSYFFAGSIDEVGLHSTALTPAQVSAIYSAGVAVLAP